SDCVSRSTRAVTPGRAATQTLGSRQLAGGAPVAVPPSAPQPFILVPRFAPARIGPSAWRRRRELHGLHPDAPRPATSCKSCPACCHLVANELLHNWAQGTR